MAGPGTPLPSFVEGVRVAAAQLNALPTLINGLYTRAMGGYRTRRPAVVVRLDGDPVSLPSGVLTTLLWDIEDRDDGGMFDPGDSALIAPVDGWYRAGMSATVAVASAAAGAALTGYVLPTTSQVAAAYAAHTNRLGAPRGHVAVSGLVACTAGTPIRFALRHTAGVTGTTTPLYGGCRAWAYWVAPLGDTDTETPPPAGGGSAGLGMSPLGTTPLGG